MYLERAFLDLEGALLHNLPKSGGAMTPLAPWFLRPCSHLFERKSTRIKEIFDSLLNLLIGIDLKPLLGFDSSRLTSKGILKDPD